MNPNKKTNRLQSQNNQPRKPSRKGRQKKRKRVETELKPNATEKLKKQ